jgi:hypothetical protein
MPERDIDQCGQPGDPYDKVFGAQLSRELDEYREARNNNLLRDERRDSRLKIAIDAQTSFRDTKEANPQ